MNAKKPATKKTAVPKKAVKEQASPKPASNSITISKTAATKLLEVAKQAKMEGKYVRVFAAHGCCGMQYGMDFDDKAGKNDKVIIENGVKLVVEKSMVELLSKATIDYVKTEHSEGFRIDNPNEKGAESSHGSCGSGCNCG